MSEVYKKLQNKAENNHINNSKHQNEKEIFMVIECVPKHAAVFE